MRLTVQFCLVSLLFLVCAAAQQPTIDPHLAGGSTANLFRLSAYAHGYMHGYEDGFHYGNIDVQFARAPRSAQRAMSAVHARPPYRREFGDKKNFSLGYRRGFHAGYADVTEQRAFRGFEVVGTAAQDLDAANYRGPDFDPGFTAGYDAAHTAKDPQHEDVRHLALWCRQQSGRPAAYCDAYARGYRMGSAEGPVDSGVSTAALDRH